MKRVWAVLAVGLAGGMLPGCGGKLPEQQGAVLEGFRFGWELFNHRLSTLHVVAGMEATEVAVVGGTSTTSEVPDLDETCDPDACDEFPFYDNALVDVWWSTLRTEEVALLPMKVSLEVGRAGAQAVATGTLPKEAAKKKWTRHGGAAILTGLSLQTDHPLEGEPSCYQPRYGWHPQRLAVSLGELTIDGDSVSVPVDAAFAAGKCFEQARTCVDEVNQRAMVALDVHLLAVVGTDAVETTKLQTEAAYPFDPGPELQEEIAPTAISFGIEEPLVGFGSLDFRFDPDRDDDRGAYLRTLGFWAGPTEANAVATNASATMLYDFTYRFEGEVRAIDAGGTIERGKSSGSFPASLGADGKPVMNTLAH